MGEILSAVNLPLLAGQGTEFLTCVLAITGGISCEIEGGFSSGTTKAEPAVLSDLLCSS